MQYSLFEVILVEIKMIKCHPVSTLSLKMYATI